MTTSNNNLLYIQNTEIKEKIILIEIEADKEIRSKLTC